MEKGVYRDTNETVTPMTGVEKIHYASMRTITRNFSVVACLVWDCSKLMDFLNKRKEAGERVTFAALIIKLIATALEKEPRMGWMFRRWRLAKPSTADIGCSVAAGTTVAPVVVVRDAGRKSLEEINTELVALATDAKARQAEEQEKMNRLGRWVPGWLLRFIITVLLTRQRFIRTLTGNFQITIIDKFDVDMGIIGTNLVNTLCIGPVKDRALVEDGQVVVRPAANFTMHCQHGILGAQEIAGFLDELKRLINNPEEVTS